MCWRTSCEHENVSCESRVVIEGCDNSTHSSRFSVFEGVQPGVR